VPAQAQGAGRLSPPGASSSCPSSSQSSPDPGVRPRRLLQGLPALCCRHSCCTGSRRSGSLNCCCCPPSPCLCPWSGCCQHLLQSAPCSEPPRLPRRPRARDAFSSASFSCLRASGSLSTLSLVESALGSALEGADASGPCWGGCRGGGWVCPPSPGSYPHCEGAPLSAGPWRLCPLPLPPPPLVAAPPPLSAAAECPLPPRLQAGTQTAPGSGSARAALHSPTHCLPAPAEAYSRDQAPSAARAPGEAPGTPAASAPGKPGAAGAEGSGPPGQGWEGGEASAYLWLRCCHSSTLRTDAGGRPGTPGAALSPP